MKFPPIIDAKNRQIRFVGYLTWLMLALLALPLGALAQNKQDLETKRKNLIREIEQTDKLLKKTTRSKEATLDRYVALQKQIERRESLIRTLQAELVESEKAIERTAGVIESLNRDIQTMQADYGKMVRNAFRRKQLSNPILYILSAGNLNQAFRRWLFLRKYDQFRKTQAKAILDTQNTLSRKIGSLEASRQKQEGLLLALQGQKSVLNTELSDKEKLLNTLKKDEGRLREDLNAKQAAHEALNQAIERVIEDEINKKVQAARRPKVNAAPSTPTSPPPAALPSSTDNTAATDDSDETAEIPDDSQSVEFRQNQGRLPWPVDNGFISRGFGRQKHPTLRNIEITNNGVDIRTDESSVVRAIYGGKVAGVQFIPGHDYTVILQHGNYYTVYSNLSETKLSKGDQVAAKQLLGRVSNNPITGASELHFELWHQKKRLNPAGWIKKG